MLGSFLHCPFSNNEKANAIFEEMDFLQNPFEMLEKPYCIRIFKTELIIHEDNISCSNSVLAIFQGIKRNERKRVGFCNTSKKAALYNYPKENKCLI